MCKASALERESFEHKCFNSIQMYTSLNFMQIYKHNRWYICIVVIYIKLSNRYTYTIVPFFIQTRCLPTIYTIELFYSLLWPKFWLALMWFLYLLNLKFTQLFLVETDQMCNLVVKSKPIFLTYVRPINFIMDIFIGPIWFQRIQPPAFFSSEELCVSKNPNPFFEWLFIN